MVDKFKDFVRKEYIPNNSILENRKIRFFNSDELEENQFIVEGIEINTRTKKVKLNDSNKGVDFEGPIYWKDKGINIISIFKRTKLNEFKGDKDLDGNPFIYALKKKYDWSFDVSYQDIKKYLNKFISNCEQLQKKYDTIIMIPSKSDLNEKFMDYLYKILKSTYKIKDVFRKMDFDHDEIEQFINYDRIKKDFSNPDYIINEIEDILYGFNGKEFETKSVPKKLLKYFNFLTKNENVDYVEAITNKNILILDDIYSSGNTISQAVRAIKQNYEPKSITVVTLLSKIMDN